MTLTRHMELSWSLFAVTLALATLLVSSHRGKSQAIIRSKPWPFNYIGGPPPNCPDDTDVLVWIHCRSTGYVNRQRLRATWANPKKFKKIGLQATVRFFVGDPMIDDGRELLLYENQKYRDIVSENYVDAYRNLTYKAESALRWITLYCDTSALQYILKTDDDVVIDIPALHRYINRVLTSHGSHTLDAVLSRRKFTKKERRRRKRLASGGMPNWFICPHKPRVPVIRKNSSKWLVTREEYPKKYYPPHCHGYGLVAKPELIPLLWHASRTTTKNWFWVDDVYFTGILALGLNVTYHATGTYFPRKALKGGWFRDEAVLVHFDNHTHRNFSNLWMRMKARSQCLPEPLSNVASGTPESVVTQSLSISESVE